MPEPKDHVDKRNLVESILRRIPGFRGYLEKEYRRESDDLQRDWLADRLQRSKRGLDTTARALADAAQIDVLPQVDRFRGRLDKLIGRIRGAMQGYSGFFDLVRVDEALLDDIYDHDIALMKEIDGLAEAIEQLPSHSGDMAANDMATKLTELSAKVDQCERLWDVREDMLKGVA